MKTAAPVSIEQWPIARFVPYARNPRKNDHAVEQMMASIREFGFKIPMLARSDGNVVDGHLRLKAAQALGMDTLPTILCDEWTDAQVKAFRLMVNRSVSWAEWDEELLALEIADLRDLKFDLDLTGFDAVEIADLLTERSVGLTDDDETPETPQKAASRLGDIWRLGRHHLLCGDATKRADVDQLLSRQRIDMVFTDPPYGIEAVRRGTIGGDKPFGSKGMNGFDGVIKAGRYAPIVGDNSIETAIAAHAICADLRIRTLLLWGGHLFAHKLPPARCWVVWDKQTDGNFADGEIAWCSAHKSIRIFRHKWSGMLKESERQERRVHPTQKPVALAEWAFSEFIPAEKRVLDLFLGSGSTLIACEKTGRTCYGLEIVPAYCDVIVTRWQNWTGKQATLHGTGKTFEEVRRKRLGN